MARLIGDILGAIGTMLGAGVWIAMAYDAMLSGRSLVTFGCFMVAVILVLAASVIVFDIDETTIAIVRKKTER